MATVAVVAKITALPGKRDEVAGILKEMIAHVEGEPDTLIYSMNLDTVDTEVIWFFELYSGPEALAAHGTSDKMKEVGGRLRELAAGRPEIHVCEPYAAKGLPA